MAIAPPSPTGGPTNRPIPAVAAEAAPRRRALNAVLAVNKRRGQTSFSCVQDVRRIFGERKVGHAGTLDPAAQGLLPVFLGSATRLVDHLHRQTKSYRCTVRLGERDDSPRTPRAGSLPAGTPRGWTSRRWRVPSAASWARSHGYRRCTPRCATAPTSTKAGPARRGGEARTPRGGGGQRHSGGVPAWRGGRGRPRGGVRQGDLHAGPGRRPRRVARGGRLPRLAGEDPLRVVRHRRFAHHRGAAPDGGPSDGAPPPEVAVSDLPAVFLGPPAVTQVRRGQPVFLPRRSGGCPRARPGPMPQAAS